MAEERRWPPPTPRELTEWREKGCPCGHVVDMCHRVNAYKWCGQPINQAEADRLRAELELAAIYWKALGIALDHAGPEASEAVVAFLRQKSEAAAPHKAADPRRIEVVPKAEADRLRAELEEAKRERDIEANVALQRFTELGEAYAQRDARPDLTHAETEALAYPLRTGPTLDEARLTGMDKLRALLDEGDEIEVRGPA